MATQEEEDQFSCQFEKQGTVMDDENPGVWVDLSRHTYYFPEAMSSFSEGRKKTKKKLESPEQQASALRIGKEYSSDYTGDGPSSSSTSYAINGMEVRDSDSYNTWMDFYRRNMWYKGKPLFTCVMAF